MTTGKVLSRNERIETDLDHHHLHWCEEHHEGDDVPCRKGRRTATAAHVSDIFSNILQTETHTMQVTKRPVGTWKVRWLLG
jgi:hypothetical protein